MRVEQPQASTPVPPLEKPASPTGRNHSSSPAGRQDDLSSRDRQRVSVHPQPSADRREKLSAVGRVASRVRTSGIIRISNAFTNKVKDGTDVDTDVNASPWGVGTAATPADVPGRQPAPPSVVANSSAVSVAVSRDGDASPPSSVGSGGGVVSPPGKVAGVRGAAITDAADMLSPLSVDSGIGSAASGLSAGSQIAGRRRDAGADRVRPPPRGFGMSVHSPSAPRAPPRKMAPRGLSSPNMKADVPPAFAQRSESSHNKVQRSESSHEKVERRMSKVMFRVDEHGVHVSGDGVEAGEKSVPMEGEVEMDPNGKIIDRSASTTEKQTFRAFISNLGGKARNDVGASRLRGLQDRKKAALSKSTSMTAGVAAAANGDIAPSDKVAAGRKSRTWRSKERDETKGRGLSNFLNIFSTHGDQGQPLAHSKSYGTSKSQSMDEGIDPHNDTSARKMPTKRDERRLRTAKKKDLSELDFADDEFYDSADDEEPSGDMNIVPSLARDDFVAYQTSQKRKTHKPRVSRLRM